MLTLYHKELHCHHPLSLFVPLTSVELVFWHCSVINRFFWKSVESSIQYLKNSFGFTRRIGSGVRLLKQKSIGITHSTQYDLAVEVSVYFHSVWTVHSASEHIHTHSRIYYISNRTSVVWNPGKFCKITPFLLKTHVWWLYPPDFIQWVENWYVHIPFYISYPQRTPWCWLCLYLFGISADWESSQTFQLRFLMFVWGPVWALMLIFSKKKSLQVLVTKTY